MYNCICIRALLRVVWVFLMSALKNCWHNFFFTTFRSTLPETNSKHLFLNGWFSRHFSFPKSIGMASSFLAGFPTWRGTKVGSSTVGIVPTSASWGFTRRGFFTKLPVLHQQFFGQDFCRSCLGFWHSDEDPVFGMFLAILSLIWMFTRNSGTSWPRIS